MARPRSDHDPVLLTKTYGPDLQRTAALLESLRAVGSNLAHLVIVDDADLPRARHELADFAAELVPTSSVTPRGLERAARWCDPTGGPGADRPPSATRRVRARAARSAVGAVDGWWSQQIVKLAICEREPATTFAHLDSDVLVLRSPTADWFLAPDGRPKLLDRQAASLKEVEWRLRAQRWFGLDRYADPPRSFTVVPQVVDADIGRGLIGRLHAAHRGPWWRQMTVHRLTEYELYGTYAAHVHRGGQDVVVEACDWSVEFSPWAPDRLDTLLDEVIDPGSEARVAQVQSKLDPGARARIESAILHRLGVSAPRSAR